MGLTFHLAFPEPLPPGERLAVHVQYDLDTYREVVLDRGGALAQPTAPDVSVSRSGPGYACRIPLPWGETPFTAQSPACLMVLTVRCFPVEAAFDADPAIVIPLEIFPP